MRTTTTRASSLVPLSCLLLACALLAPAGSATADGMRTYHRHVRYHLPPERHVIEKVLPPGSGVFLINGRYFTATTPACARWTAGDRIRLLAGDLHGYCDTAIFRNLRRRGTCTTWCH